ncbi:MAG: S41 family peptidase [Planctomycetota bacterium]
MNRTSNPKPASLLSAASALVASAVITASAAASDLWTSSRGLDGDAIAKLVADLPGSPSFDRARLSGSSLIDNLAERETMRTEAIAEARKKLAELVAESNDPDAQRPPELAISEALTTAVELSLLYPERGPFLGKPETAELVKRAEWAAKAAEDRGDWMLASELFYRLSVLFLEEGTYQDDSTRQGRRLSIIRLYAPEALWQMRNARRLLEDLDPLPEYNPLGDTFEEKLNGVSRDMVIRALRRSAERNVERQTMTQLLAGGLQGVELLVTTPELATAFPGMNDDAKVKAFLSGINAEIDAVSNAPGPLGYIELRGLVRRVSTLNDRTIGFPKEVLYHEFGNGAMHELDEYSAIIWPDELRRFQRQTQGSFVGVGIQINQNERYDIVVVSPIEGKPAHLAGIRANDIITEIDGETTAGFTLDQAVTNITGPEGTSVTLTVEREVENDEGETEIQERSFRMKRARIELPTVKGWRRTGPNDQDWDWFIDEDQGLGYIRLTQFSETTTRDFDSAIRVMQQSGLSGLVLDLRYNPGGLLDQAVEISNRFIPEGEIVRTEDAAGVLQDSQRARRGRATLTDIPVIVLVNENSASASEIVSGALQDYAASGVIDALVVGSRSFGKGSVQNVWPLQGARAAMKLTTQYYKLPAGRLIHRTPGASQWGVEPDVEVEMLPEQQLDSYSLRRRADLSREINDPFDAADIEEFGEPDPDRLLNEPIDLQLQTAVALLKAQRAERTAQAMAQRGEEPTGQ